VSLQSSLFLLEARAQVAIAHLPVTPTGATAPVVAHIIDIEMIEGVDGESLPVTPTGATAPVVAHIIDIEMIEGVDGESLDLREIKKRELHLHSLRWNNLMISN
jgi:hypothetical protein